MLRVGLIGAGWVAAHHLAGWRQEAARARVVAIADPPFETGLADNIETLRLVERIYAIATR